MEQKAFINWGTKPRANSNEDEGDAKTGRVLGFNDPFCSATGPLTRSGLGPWVLF